MVVDPVSYRYVKTNLLVERYHYMYTPHEGLDFLLAYRLQRQELREKLLAEYYQLQFEDSANIAIALEIHDAMLGDSSGRNMSPLAGRKMEVLPAQPGKVEFFTNALLLDLWQGYLHDSGLADHSCLSWVEFLMKKFEVFKRLYVGYSSNLKPLTRDYHHLDNYALMASLLMYLNQQTPSLRDLNATLKLIDLLASVDVDNDDELTKIVLLAASELELSAIEGLLLEHKIKL